MKKFRVNLMEILKDHKATVIEIIKEETDEILIQEIGREHDRMITEVKELLVSS
jgi:phosphoribosyl-ATP pyrophosphohydrolase|tara:strand:+ start:68 stop:229 length:162 start_codon:yes stop_codon:yes gene_type:complete